MIVFGDLDKDSTDGCESRVWCWGIGEVDCSWVSVGLDGEFRLIFESILCLIYLWFRVTGLAISMGFETWCGVNDPIESSPFLFICGIN